MFDEQRLDFLIKFGSYKIKYLAIRVFLISIVSVGIFSFIEAITPIEDLLDIRKEYMYFIGIVAFNSISEINLLLMRLLNRSKTLRWKIYLQVVIVVSVSVLLSFFWVNVTQQIAGDGQRIISHRATQIALMTGLLVIVIHLLINIISNLLREWINSRHEIDELREAKLLSDYNSLKDRLNPHFLFNNLSVLKSLIHYSPDSAAVFTQNFTNVYRYVLKSYGEKTVLLKEELEFLDSYIALHKERIGEGLIVHVEINESDVQKSIPPMSLQLLVENAIKHNVANKSHALKIEIFSENEMVVVRNNLKAKESTYSTNTGLKSLISQYKLIADKEPVITETTECFKVELPLI